MTRVRPGPTRREEESEDTHTPVQIKGKQHRSRARECALGEFKETGWWLGEASRRVRPCRRGSMSCVLGAASVQLAQS